MVRNGSMSGDADLYVSLNSRKGREKDSYNFGFFVAYPSAAAVALFERYLRIFLNSRGWDQEIFAKLLVRARVDDALRVALLPAQHFAAVHLEVAAGAWPPPRDGLVTLHATCIEGERTKELVVYSAYTRPPPLPPRPLVVALDASAVDFQSAADVDAAGRLLLYAARLTGAR
mmetsp:Transcript_30294/g.96633  ORF Transcript_30294/g.96633 Transcript_30294/m.96633 type:complete len:173 (-) Transcript_30294:108-626(-)